MSMYWILLRRELSGYLASLSGYIIVAATVLLLGFSFLDIISKLNTTPTEAPVTEIFYSTYYFWLILLLLAPVITMRLFAGEKVSGTFETLMTTPVREWHVVMSKFTAALIFYAVTWLPLLIYVLIVHRYANDASALSWGILACTFTGILLIGSVYMALGCFASALTGSQMVAAMVSYFLGIAFFLLSLRALMPIPQVDWVGRALQYVAMTEHMEQFARGVMDTRHVIFYGSITVLFLFLTVKVVESRRWR